MKVGIEHLMFWSLISLNCEGIPVPVDFGTWFGVLWFSLTLLRLCARLGRRDLSCWPAYFGPKAFGDFDSFCLSEFGGLPRRTPSLVFEQPLTSRCLFSASLRAKALSQQLQGKAIKDFRHEFTVLRNVDSPLDLRLISKWIRACLLRSWFRLKLDPHLSHL
jgi:hypothetical protein